MYKYIYHDKAFNNFVASKGNTKEWEDIIEANLLRQNIRAKFWHLNYIYKTALATWKTKKVYLKSFFKNYIWVEYKKTTYADALDIENDNIF